MAFCTKCGSPLTETGVCAACMPHPAAAPAPAVPPTPPAAPVQAPPTPSAAPVQAPPTPPAAPVQGQTGAAAPQPTVVYVKSEPNPIVTEAVTILKAFFSANPQEAVTSAANSAAHVWVVLGGISVLAAILACILIPIGFLGDALEWVADGFGFYMKLFGCGLLLSVVSFGTVSGCVKALFAIYKQDVSFIRVMNMVAASSIISSVASVAAILFSFLFPEASLLLLMVGALGSVVFLYDGIQKAASFRNGPLWGFLGVCAVYIIVLSAIASRLADSAAGGAFSSLFRFF